MHMSGAKKLQHTRRVVTCICHREDAFSALQPTTVRVYHVQPLSQAKAAQTAHTPKLFIYDEAEFGITGEELLDCYRKLPFTRGVPPWAYETNTAEDSGDIWLYYAAKHYAKRTMDPKEADVIYVPFLLRVSFSLTYTPYTHTHTIYKTNNCLIFLR